MASLGYGYWALIALPISNPVVYTTAVWMTRKGIPGKPKSNVGMRFMMRFGGTLTLNGLIVIVRIILKTCF